MTTTTAALLLAILSVQTPEAAWAAWTGESLGPAPEPPKRGIGYLVGGGILTGAGAAVLTASGLAFASGARCEEQGGGECWQALAGFIELPFGIVGVAVGVPLLVVGAGQNRYWRRWQREHGLTLRPRFDRGRGSVTLGVALRF